MDLADPTDFQAVFDPARRDLIRLDPNNLILGKPPTSPGFRLEGQSGLAVPQAVFDPARRDLIRLDPIKSPTLKPP